jgi:hypothetical protein
MTAEPSTTTSSLEHCQRCLGHLKLLVRTPKMSQEDLTKTIEAYSRSLVSYDPRAVSAGCKRIGEELGHWPSLKELRQIVTEEQSLINRPQALPGMNGESFADRLERIGFTPSDFNIRNRTLWGWLMGSSHRAMNDVTFAATLREVLAGRDGKPDDTRPLDDAARGRIVATIRHIRNNSGRFAGAQSLIAIGETMLGGQPGEAQP